jgi:outer membrane protein assembly factor BamA
VKSGSALGALLLACLVAAAPPVAAETKTRIFPLPMYTTVPNEGSTYGFMPVFMRADEDVVSSIIAPSVSYNSSAKYTATFRYYRYLSLLDSWRFIVSASTVINRSIWLEWDDDRRRPHTFTKNLVFRVRRNLFYRFFGLGPETTAEDESSYTRLYATASARVGWNFTENLNVALTAELRGDRPERHAIKGLPETQDAFPDAPGLDGSALLRGGFSFRYDTRADGDYSRSGFATELAGSVAKGLKGFGHLAQLSWSARLLVPEFSWLQGAARLYWQQVIGGTDVPFYDRSTLGGEVLFRGFQEDRFIDMGAWEIEAEQRLTMFQTHMFGVVSDWRIDPFVSAGQVYGEQSPWAHVRVAAGTGLRVLIHPDILGRIDLAFGGEGLRAYVVLGYPY